MGCGSSQATWIPADLPEDLDDYEPIQILGEGGSGKVLLVKSKSNKCRYALKIMNANNESHVANYKRETSVMKLMSHPNLLKMVKHWQAEDKLCILLVACQGGTLYDCIEREWTEQHAVQVLTGFLHGLTCMHSMKIAHRDIKPENFAFIADDLNSLTLIDFGNAVVNTPVDDHIGSPLYVPPEVLGSGSRSIAVSMAGDMWSLGVLVWTLLSGRPPFRGNSLVEILKNVKKCKLNLDEMRRAGASDAAMDFVSKLIVKDPHQRMSSLEAINHPWIKEYEKNPVAFKPFVLQSLLDFVKASRLKLLVAKMLSEGQLQQAEQEKLDDMFKEFDKNGDGKLQPEEIAEAMKSFGNPGNVGQAQFMKEYDKDGDGEIDKKEIAKGFMLHQLSSVHLINQTFDAADLDNNGFLEEKEFNELMKGMLDKDGVAALLKEVDSDGDGRLSPSEWIAAMTRARKRGEAETQALSSVMGIVEEEGEGEHNEES